MLAVLRTHGIDDPRVLEAMAAVPRELFVPQRLRHQAYADRALPLGHGQTISQPLMVAEMVRALELQEGERVLDVGTGSGYQAAVIAACGAQVVGIERIPELAAAAQERLRGAGFPITVICGDGSQGLPSEAPFDAIVVAASAPSLPPALPRQLREGGRLVIPLRQRASDDAQLVRLRVEQGRWLTEELGACRFVPLISGGAYPED